MTTVVAVMDRSGFGANTDVIVLADAGGRRLLWIPRDLWCPALGDRINTAWARGGATLLQRALAEHEIIANDFLCLARDATEAGLDGARVVVPVPVRLEFDYPLSPSAPIEAGSKRIRFEPPWEVLEGERIHQWLGARRGSDLHRIERQKVLLRRLLEQGFDFRRFLAEPAWFVCSGDAALAELSQVRRDWRFDTLAGCGPAVVAGKQVLVRGAGPAG